MEKFLVTLEYRYKDSPNIFDSIYKEKINTIGVFENIKDAIASGNNVLIELEKHFKLNEHYNKKERLTEDKKLITNLGYLKTSFDFYLKIQTLKYNDFNESLQDVLKSVNNYNEYKKNN